MAVNIYQEKACSLIIDDTKNVGKLIGNIKKKQYEDKCEAIDLSFIIGYENGCLMKDEQEQINMNKIKRFDTMTLVNMVENVSPLITYLKNNVDDTFVKGKVIEQLGILANYVANTCNSVNYESEEN
ncbi:hypothetical protein [Clostridium estertheticum]|uniref:hypothetical protein n=1 Tax=Clostridium estertheticum TaxID=238834 RepID=UPI00124CE6B3|nr:hypothetical protein [Clostridium estertheticum]MBZ9616781.1 hypothetical protein [Clostridium estertheticum subsp. laramiense]WAG72488.1 hypothetical protein LL032_15185 [Clostridium estertheticum]